MCAADNVQRKMVTWENGSYLIRADENNGCCFFCPRSPYTYIARLNGCSFSMTIGPFARIAIISYAQEICNDSCEMQSLSCRTWKIQFSRNWFLSARQLLHKFLVDTQSDFQSTRMQLASDHRRTRRNIMTKWRKGETEIGRESEGIKDMEKMEKKRINDLYAVSFCMI